ncbi:MAG: hypothetical protein GY704_17250 [Phycisphaeraceae bacterium]|nr:hypothetical protein [Phycisphaeraceae bacterium]
MKRLDAGIRTVFALLLLVGSSANAGQNPVVDGPPGSRQAIESATRLAADDVAGKIMQGLPAGLELVAVLPLFGDAEGMTTVTFEAALTAASGRRSIRRIDLGSTSGGGADPVDVDDDEAIASRVLEYVASDGPGVIAWGRVRYARIDESGLAAQARIEVTTSDPTTGESAVFIGDGSVPIDPATLAMGLGRDWVDDPWFVPTVISGTVVGCGLAVVLLFSRRRLALALKSRNLKH